MFNLPRAHTMLLSITVMSACKAPGQQLSVPQMLTANSRNKRELESFKSDQWDFSNNPELFGLPVTYELNILPKQRGVA